MRCFTVFKSELGVRLDPVYVYEHRAYRGGKANYAVSSLGSLLAMPPQYGANESATEGNPETDYRYIRITDVNEFGNLRRDGWKTAKNIDKKYILEEGDVLFARSGATAGKTYIYSPNDGKAIFAGYMIRFRFDRKKVDPLFVFFYTQLSRYEQWVYLIQRPAGQPNINSEEFKAFEIPVPNLNVQKKVIGIMSRAYEEKQRLEKEADNLLASIDGYILDQLKIELPKPETRMCLSVSSADLRGKRYDPMPYQPVRVDAVKAIQKSKYELHNLEDVADFPKAQESQNNGNLSYLGLENVESNSGLYVDSKEEKQEFGTALHFYPGDVLFPKLRPYLNKVYLADIEGYCSTEFHVLKAGADILPEYLAAFLRSQAVVRQTSCLMTGNTLPRLQTEDVQTLPIPVPPKSLQKEISKEVMTRVQKVMSMKSEAIEQLSQAKSEVEEILYGQTS